jgi:hypothetical protein
MVENLVAYASLVHLYNTNCLSSKVALVTQQMGITELTQQCLWQKQYYDEYRQIY